jgi:hypothetical protein
LSAKSQMRRRRSWRRRRRIRMKRMMMMRIRRSLRGPENHDGVVGCMVVETSLIGMISYDSSNDGGFNDGRL